MKKRLQKPFFSWNITVVIYIMYGEIRHFGQKIRKPYTIIGHPQIENLRFFCPSPKRNLISYSPFCFCIFLNFSTLEHLFCERYLYYTGTFSVFNRHPNY